MFGGTQSYRRDAVKGDGADRVDNKKIQTRRKSDAKAKTLARQRIEVTWLNGDG